MGSATDCISRKKGLCNLKNDCYALKAEKRWKNVLPSKRAESEMWLSESAESIAYQVLSKDLRAYKHKIEYIRFNESGDINSKADIDKLRLLAELLPQFIIYGYTHRIDLKEYLQDLPDNLVINGSDFMLDNEFKVIDKSEVLDYDLICPADCTDCNLCKTKGKKLIGVIKH